MRSSRSFALFSFTLFFSLFSVVSLLLQNTSTNLLSLVLSSHFLFRLVLVGVGMVLFLFFPKNSFLEKGIFFFVLLILAYFVSFLSLFFVRDGNPRFYSEVISPGLLLTSSSLLYLSEVIDNDSTTIEDVLLFSFIVSSVALILFLLTDFAFLLISFITLSLLAFSFKFSFGIKVSLLSILLIALSVVLFMTSTPFVNTFVDGLNVNKPFMTFYKKTEVSLSSSLSPFVFYEYATGEMIFSLLYRFKVYGALILITLLFGLVILLYSTTSFVSKNGDEKRARRNYGIAVLFSLMILFPLLSLSTSLPFFKCDLPFITPSNLNVFVEILLLSYVNVSLKNLPISSQNKAELTASEA